MISFTPLDTFGLKFLIWGIKAYIIHMDNWGKAGRGSKISKKICPRVLWMTPIRYTHLLFISCVHDSLYFLSALIITLNRLSIISKWYWKRVYLDIKEYRIRRVLFWGKAKNSQFSLFVNAIHSSFIGNLHFLFAFERKRREKIKDKWSEPCLKPNIQLRKTVSRMNKILGFFSKKEKKNMKPWHVILQNKYHFAICTTIPTVIFAKNLGR